MIDGGAADAAGCADAGGGCEGCGRGAVIPVMAALMAELKSAASMAPDGPGILDGGDVVNASIASRSCRCRWSPSSAPGAP